MAEKITRIQVRFSEQTKYGTFTDALYFTQAEYDAISPEDINAQIQDRVANYIAAVEAPGQDVQPSKAELQAAKAELEAQVSDLNEKISKKG